MTSTVKLVDPRTQPAPVILQADWLKCFLCQEDTNEKLCCPANSKRTDIGAGYTSLADDLIAFHSAGRLPDTVFLTSWKWPLVYGESKLVVMFGGLHIEAAALKTIGYLLEGSGWTSAIVHTRVVTAGTANSFLKGAHITRTRRGPLGNSMCHLPTSGRGIPGVCEVCGIK